MPNIRQRLSNKPMRAPIPLALIASTAASLLLSTPAAAAAPQTHSIVIDKMKFGPVPPKVRRGDTIVWINRDIFRHTATAANKSFDVDLPPSTRRSMTVRSAGAFAFTCKYHPGMRAVLRVAAR
jgi:plastocyanin